MVKNGAISASDMFNIETLDGEKFTREDDVLGLKGEGDGEGNNDDDDDGQSPPVDEPSNPPSDEGEGNDDNQNPKHNEKPVGQGVDYRRIVNSLEERGALDSLSDVKFQMEDGSEVGIEDIDLSDENSFLDFMVTLIENQKDELTKDKVDMGSLSDMTKKLIKAEKAGANIVDILKEYDKTSAAIEQLDIDNKKDQLKIIRQYISTMGLSSDDADEFYENIVAKGEDFIEARAVKYKNELDKRMNALIEQKTKEAEEKKQADAAALKEFRKSLKASFQEKYQLKENVLTKALDFRFKGTSQNPNVPAVMEKAREMLNDPEVAPDLIMFLMNPDEFIKQKSNSKVKEINSKTFKMITHSNKTRRTAPVDDKGNPTKGMMFDEISVDGKF